MTKIGHEGGISTPLIAHWPRGIDPSRHGKLERQPGHLIDVMATFVDVSGINYPGEFGGQKIQPMEGVSLKPAFSGTSLNRKDALYFEHHLNCAIRDGKWKLVRKGNSGGKSKLFDWELYNMEADRIEVNNVANKHTEKAAELEAKWEAWATRARVKPWPWKFPK